MSQKSNFDFLGSTWGIGLLAKAQEEIEQNVESLDQWYIEEYIKDTDIRKFGVVSRLPKDLTRMSADTLPPGKYLVQVTKMVDITQPTKFQEEFGAGKYRLLALDLADGEQKFRAIEYAHLKAISDHDRVPPGTKLLLWSTQQAPLRVQNGHLLLTSDAVQVLGGHVPKLVESWQAQKDVEATRLLWRTEGMKKKTDGEGAPPWVDFDPKKAPRGGIARSALAQEKRDWRQGVSAQGAGAVTTASACAVGARAGASAEPSEGPRFDVQDFKADGEAVPVQTQLSSSVFKQAERSKGGKGKGKEKRDDDDRGRRRGRGGFDDEWGGEEKRAPAVASLAAFIKPTKKDDVELLAPAPSVAATGGGDASSGGWELADSWAESGWGASSGGWGASGESWTGGGGGGWRGGGGGKGHRGGSSGGKRGGGGGGKKGGGGGGGKGYRR